MSAARPQIAQTGGCDIGLTRSLHSNGVVRDLLSRRDPTHAATTNPLLRSPRASHALAALILAIAIAIACSERPPTPGAASDASSDSVFVEPGDSTLVAGALRIVRALPQLDSLWPGYWTRDKPFILFQPDGAAILVARQHDAPGFRPLGGENLPDELRGIAHLLRGPLPGVAGLYRIDYSIGPSKAVAVEFHGSQLRTGFGTLFHEGFHGFQVNHFTKHVGDGQFVDEAAISATAFFAMAEVEREMLEEMLDAPPNDLAQLTRDYLAVRRLRQASVSQAVRDREDAMERNEGSAHLVGLRGAGIVFPEVDTDLVARLSGDLLRLVERDHGLVQGLMRWRLYGTGAAAGIVLDRLNVPWQAELQRGATFVQLLAKAVRFDTAAAADVESIMGRYEYSELLASARADSSATIEWTFAKFDSLAPARIVIEVRAPLKGSETHFQVSGDGGFAHIGERATAIPMVDLYEWSAPGTSIIVRGHPVLQDWREARALFALVTRRIPIRFVIPVDVLPTELNGEALTDRSRRISPLRFQHAGVELDFEKGADVMLRGNELIIRARR
jgi:hypothetical protein